ncbi:MAG TPA: hypothetical protein VKB88_14745 [Bryobacteraceae bacterium]|nr:hypothetical protein [Bryobacteraceae bacterium]
MGGATHPRETTAWQREAVGLLVAAGARVELEWLEREKVHADPNMFAALGHR